MPDDRITVIKLCQKNHERNHQSKLKSGFYSNAQGGTRGNQRCLICKQIINPYPTLGRSGPTAGFPTANVPGPAKKNLIANGLLVSPEFRSLLLLLTHWSFVLACRMARRMACRRMVCSKKRQPAFHSPRRTVLQSWLDWTIFASPTVIARISHRL